MSKTSQFEFDKGKKVTLQQDDVLNFLSNQKKESINLIVTDPAYSGMNNYLKLGKGRIVGDYSKKGQKNEKWFEEFQDNEESYRAFLELSRDVLTPDGHIYIMFDSYSLLSLGPLVRDYFDIKNLITWDKVNMGMGHYYRRRHEFILFATNKNTKKIKNRKFPDVWRIKRVSKSNYPTQKPVEIFDIMLSASTKEGDNVCDPFLGSGSAAISAIKNKCNFIGSDISTESLKISSERVEQFIINEMDILQPKSLIPEEEKVFWK